MRDGPPHREVQGHGRLVVVVGVTPHQGAEESSAQGEGAEVSVAERHVGVRDAQRLTCRNASRFGGDQARESRVLGNGHALCAPCGALLYSWHSQEELGGRFLGHPAYLRAKAHGDQSMLGTRRSSEDVVGRGAARPVCHGQCLIASSPISARRKCPPIGRTSVRRCCCLLRSERGTGATSRQQGLTNEVRQGDEWTAYSTLGRTTTTYHGIAYGPRGLRQRTAHRSRGGHVPPGRSGKPTTGQRGRGDVILSKGRYA